MANPPQAAVVTGANRGLGLEVRGPFVSPAKRLQKGAAGEVPTAFRPHKRDPVICPLQLCRQLLSRGWLVLAACRRSSEELAALQQQPGASGSQTSAGSLRVIEGVDVGSDSCVAVLQAAAAGVPVGWLICNAGVLSVDSVAELDTDVMRQQVRITQWCFSCCRFLAIGGFKQGSHNSGLSCSGHSRPACLHARCCCAVGPHPPCNCNCMLLANRHPHCHSRHRRLHHTMFPAAA
jgi:hypothetical protein